MADIEQFTSEQAQALLEKDFASLQKQEPAPATQVVPAITPEPVAEAVVVPEIVTPEVVSPAVVEPAKPEPAAPAEAVAPVAPPTQDDPYAWVEKIPEDLREKVIAEIRDKFKYEHASRSDAGRVRTLQKKLLEQHRSAAEAKPATAPAPAERQPPTTPEGWQALMKADPEIAEAIEARLKSEIESAVGSVRNELQEFKKTAVDPLYEQNEQEYRKAQASELKRIVPNVEQVLQSEEYNFWLSNVANSGTRQMALTSWDAQDAVAALRQYADDMVRLGYIKPPQQTERVPSTQPAAPAAPTKADEIAAEREKRLKAPTPTAQPPLAPTGSGDLKGPVKAGDDAEAIFLQAWNKLNKKT